MNFNGRNRHKTPKKVKPKKEKQEKPASKNWEPYKGISVGDVTNIGVIVEVSKSTKMFRLSFSEYTMCNTSIKVKTLPGVFSKELPATAVQYNYTKLLKQIKFLTEFSFENPNDYSIKTALKDLLHFLIYNLDADLSESVLRKKMKDSYFISKITELLVNLEKTEKYKIVAKEFDI